MSVSASTQVMISAKFAVQSSNLTIISFICWYNESLQNLMEYMFLWEFILLCINDTVNIIMRSDHLQDVKYIHFFCVNVLYLICESKVYHKFFHMKYEPAFSILVVLCPCGLSVSINCCLPAALRSCD